MFSSLLPSGTCTYLWGSCLNHGDFQRSTQLSPFLGSKTPFWSLWLTVGAALQKQLWGGLRVILCGEILTTDWIFKAESLRSCPAEWLLLFFPSPSLSFSRVGLHTLCKGSGADSWWWSFLHKLNVSESLAFVPSIYFFSCSKMIFSKSQILVLLSYGWFCWWRTTEFLHHLYVCSWTTLIGVSSSVCPFI